MKLKKIPGEIKRVSVHYIYSRLALRREYGFYPPSDLRFSLSEKEINDIDFAVQTWLPREKSKRGGPERG